MWKLWKTMLGVPTFDPYEQLRNQLTDVKAEVGELKTLVKGIELEWDQVYDKLQHQMARIVKRAGAAAQEAAQATNSEPPAPDPLDPIGTHGRLQAARRRMRGVN
jgi:hypothetical protein